MRRIFLSPHLDDAVFSCGGPIWQVLQTGCRVEVWTLFAADPPKTGLSPFALELHSRWQGGTNPVELRREEDLRAMQSLGCGWRHFNYLDCIYRRDLQNGEAIIQNRNDLFSSDPKRENPLMQQISQELQNHLPPDAELFIPLGVGNHVDHLLTRLAAEMLTLPLNYYADFPYAGQEPEKVQATLPLDARANSIGLSDQALMAWQNAIACYTSQISSFWSSLNEMKTSVANYSQQPFALTTWRKG